MKDILLGFNTSHVTLYLVTDRYKVVQNEFQYISCYSLSRRTL